MLVERNLVVRKPLEKRISHFLELAESRLTWARSQVLQLWDPEWKKSNNKIEEGVAASGARSPQPLVVMDARWWRWNIAFALIPAVLIGTYCEFRGQYMMYKFHQEQELEQARRLMGEEYVETHRDVLVGPPPENILKRLLNAFMELKDFLLGTPPDMRHSDSGSRTVLHSSSVPTPPQPSIPSSSGASAENAHTAEPPRIAEAASLEQLQARLQQLEAIVMQQEQHRGSRELANLNQSGVKNRMEQAMIDSWAKSVGDSPAVAQVPEKEQQQQGAKDSLSFDVTPVMAKISVVLERVAQRARDFASIPPTDSGSEEKSDNPGLKRSVLADPPSMLPPVLDESTAQSSRPGDSTTSEVVRRTNPGPSWWPWA